MSYIRHKMRNGKKYAYEVSSYWDAEMKRSRQKSIYLGCIEPSGELTPTGSKRYERESLILDFGDGFCLHHFLQQSELYKSLKDALSGAELMNVIPLIFYRISLASAMHNCEKWL